MATKTLPIRPTAFPKALETPPQKQPSMDTKINKLVVLGHILKALGIAIGAASIILCFVAIGPLAALGLIPAVAFTALGFYLTKKSKVTPANLLEQNSTALPISAKPLTSRQNSQSLMSLIPAETRQQAPISLPEKELVLRSNSQSQMSLTPTEPGEKFTSSVSLARPAQNASTQLSPINSIYTFPTKDQAQKVFWGLGDRFWMQMIDSIYHHLGPMVFDEGLHKREKEPGFFASLKQGCLFASDHLGEKLTVDFYKALHKVLCAHFREDETNTEMSSWATGRFRYVESNFKIMIRNPYFFSDDKQHKQALEHYQIVKIFEDKDYLEEMRVEKPDKYEQICKNYADSKKWVEEYEASWSNKIEAIKAYVAQICTELSLPKFVKFGFMDQTIRVNYCLTSQEEHEKVTQVLFDRYNRKIAEANNRLQTATDPNVVKAILIEKVGIIAELFQLLEWLHPFPDGQGRTDLVLQAKLLSEEGLNPAILYFPYFSSVEPLPAWRDYLLKGMDQWKQEQAKSSN